MGNSTGKVIAMQQTNRKLYAMSAVDNPTIKTKT